MYFHPTYTAKQLEIADIVFTYFESGLHRRKLSTETKDALHKSAFLTSLKHVQSPFNERLAFTVTAFVAQNVARS